MARQEWEDAFRDYADNYPELAEELRAALKGALPAGWDSDIPSWTPDDGSLATRKAAGEALDAIRSRCWTLKCILGCRLPTIRDNLVDPSRKLDRLKFFLG